MITEIELAQKLSKISDPLGEKNIISSGRVRGINIYNRNVNIMIEQDVNNNQSNIDTIKNSISKLLGTSLLSVPMFRTARNTVCCDNACTS